MVTCYHDGPDAGVLALLNGGHHLRPDGVKHACEAHKGKPLLEMLVFLILRHRFPVPEGRTQHTQGPVGHGLVFLKDFLALFISHRTRLITIPVGAAVAQQRIRRALCKLAYGTLFAAHQGTHPLTDRVKGRLTHAGHSVLESGLWQAQRSSIHHQRVFRGFAYGLALLQFRVRSQGHGGSKQFLVCRVSVNHCHLVLRQGAGFVRADDLGGPKCFHRCKLPDDGIAVAHVGNTHREHDGYHRSQTLRNGGHCQRHSNHESLQNGLHLKVLVANQAEDEDKSGNSQHQVT